MTACLTTNIYINKFLLLIGYDMPGFKRGAFIALGGVLLLIIFMNIIVFLFRKNEKRCNGLFSDAEQGKLYISKEAIADLVKSKESEVPGITVVKTHIIKRGKAFSVRVETELINDSGILPERISHLQSKILTAINDNLGISSIKKVDVAIRRVKQAN